MQQDISLEELLQALLLAVDGELASLAEKDEEIKLRITNSQNTPGTFDEDILSKLLREASHKTNLLNFYRRRHFHQNQQAVSAQTTRNISPLIKSIDIRKQSNNLTPDIVWATIQLYSEQAHAIEHNGVTLKIVSLERSAGKIRFPFSILSTVPINISSKLDNFSLTEIHQGWPLPTLMGIRLKDNQETQYMLESPELVLGPQGEPSKWWMKSELVFSFDQPELPQSFSLSIQRIIFLPQGVFAVSSDDPLIINGPWKFTFNVH